MTETSEKICAEHVVKLNKTFSSGKTLPYEFRVTQLLALKKLVDENDVAIVEAIGKDLGRGVFESAGLDVLPLKLEIDHAIKNLKTWMQPVFTMQNAMTAPSTSEIRYDPLGVVLIIAPFNYPFYLALAPLLGAIEAGNCAVVKPSELTKASEALLFKLIPLYLDNDCYKVAIGGIATTTSLLNQKYDKIFFTGSTRVGKVVAQAAAKFMTPVALELGGKSPTIIDSTVTDMELVVKRIIWGKVANAGQTCIAPDYVMCHSSKYKEFLEKSVKCLKTFYGDDVQKSIDFGRIVSSQHCQRLQGLLEGRGSGRIVCGGKIDISDRYVEPTIVADVKLDSKLMSEEIFGPILSVMQYDSIDDVIKIINSDTLKNPLALYVFSKDRKMIDKVTALVPSGGVLVNDTLFHALNPYTPFGGVGGSGSGAYHGFFSYEVFSHRRTILRRDDKMITDAPFRYPPYSAFNLSIFKAAARLPDLYSITGTSFCLGLLGGVLGSVAAVAAALNRESLLEAITKITFFMVHIPNSL